MSDTPASDRVHEPTAIRLERAKRDGDVARSAELAFAIQLCGAVAVAWLLAGSVSQWMAQTAENTWSGATVRVDQFDSVAVTQMFFAAIVAVAPMLSILMLVGIASWWLQTGPTWIASRPAPDLSRVNPGNWFGRVFSMSGLAAPLLGLPRALIAVVAAVIYLWCQRLQLFTISNLAVDAMVGRLFDLVLSTAMCVGVALLFTAAIDYAMRWAGHRQRLRMSDQELRDENKMQGAGNALRAAQVLPRQ